MKFGQLVFDRPLLTLRANEGCKYMLARDVASREPWFLSVDPDGSMSGQPVEGLEHGASTSPFQTWIAGGRLPEGASRAEVELDDELYESKARAGLWLAGIPWGNRDCEGTVRFVGGDGDLVASAPLTLSSAPPLPR